MVSFNICFFPIPAAFLLTFQLVSALPTQTFNSKFNKIAAFDNENVLARRDGEGWSNLVRRAPVASPCSLLDLDDAQQLPGWSQVEQYAKDTWGTGDWTVIINPPGYKDKRATMCVADSVPVVATEKPQCNASRVDIRPNRDHHIKVVQGYTNSGFWNITNVTSAAHSLFFAGKFKMPNITQGSKDLLHPIIGHGEFINAPYNSFLTTATNTTTKDTEVTQVQDKSCIGTINQEICTIPAQGRIQLIATGYIWFQYQTKRAPLANPNGGKHSRYAVKIQEVLKNATDRSAWIDFSGYMNTTMRSDYFDECRWKFKL
jgi:hypothetical protein